MRRYESILLALSICVSFPLESSAQLSGPLSGTIGPGVYTITDNVWVSDGDSLTVAPGATFLFAGNYEFDINGYLYAVGTVTDSIVFMPNVGVYRGEGLDFNDSADDLSRLEYCIITGSNSSGITFDNASPTVSNCTIRGNWIDYGYGAGILCLGASPTISNCVIQLNRVYYSGGGIAMRENSSPTIENCRIGWNTTDEFSGGGVYCENSSAIFSNCIISANLAEFGGGLYVNGSDLILENCTISGNWANFAGGGIALYWSTATIRNCIVNGNTGNGGIYMNSAVDAEVTYSDFFDNTSGDITGSPPANFGDIVTVNSNGDSCDTYSNIFLAPLFYSTIGDSAFFLTASSPCVDAGDPGSPNVPWGGWTRDIGAIEYDQGFYYNGRLLIHKPERYEPLPGHFPSETPDLPI